MLALLCAMACGHAERDRDGLSEAESGGEGSAAGSGAAAGTSVIMIGGSSGTGGSFDPSGACEFSATSCAAGEYYVDVDDGGEQVRLAFPGSPGCGECSPDGCVLFGRGTSACKSLEITFAACFGEDGAPPCLELGGTSGRYIDASGEVFDVISIEEVAMRASGLDLIDMSLAIGLGEPAEQGRSLAVEVRLCGSIHQPLVPC